MNRLLFLSILVISLFTGCDKPKKLNAQQAVLDAQRLLARSETDSYEQKMKALGLEGVYGTAEATLAKADVIWKNAEAAEQTSAAKLQKWTEFEKKLIPLRDEVAAYKANNLR